MTARMIVPVANEKNAAWNVPIVLPSWELIGPWRATMPPTTAVERDGDPAVHYFASSQFGPTPGVDRERRVHLGGADHLARDDLGRLLGLLRRALEQQLVVDLQDAAGLQAGLARARRGSGPSRP